MRSQPDDLYESLFSHFPEKESSDKIQDKKIASLLAEQIERISTDHENFPSFMGFYLGDKMITKIAELASDKFLLMDKSGNSEGYQFDFVFACYTIYTLPVKLELASEFINSERGSFETFVRQVQSQEENRDCNYYIFIIVGKSEEDLWVRLALDYSKYEIKTHVLPQAVRPNELC